MSLKSIFQVLVYIESIRNVELGAQGLYQVSMRLVKNCAQKKEFGQPYLILDMQKELECRKKNKIVSESRITDNQYHTKSFIIKYQDEKIDLHQALAFRFQLENFPGSNHDNIFLQFDLYYSIFNKQQEESKIQLNLTKISSLKIQINNLQQGICDMLQVIFEEHALASMNIYVFSLLMDQKFQKFTSKKKQKTVDQIRREKIENIEQFCMYANRKVAYSSINFYNDYVKSIRYSSFITKNKWIQIMLKPTKNQIRVPKGFYTNQEQGNDVQGTQKDFFNYLSWYKPAKINFELFEQEIKNICNDNHQFMKIFIKQLQSNKIKFDLLNQRQLQKIRERYNEFIFKNHNYLKDKHSFCKKIRKKSYYNNLPPLNLQQVELIHNIRNHPIIFHQTTEIKKPRQTPKNTNTLFVFSHGFQGYSEDMKRIKNILKILYPNAYFLLARVNQNDTLGNIQIMGQKIALELVNFIKSNEIQKHLKIHMIGHSMGSIILRASIQFLNSYKQNFGNFVSFSSPHLGYLFGTKPLINTGLWLLKSFKNIQSIEQLTMSDEKKLHETMLYKLSSAGTLKDFRKLVLISSYQDKYVPWHSARIHHYSNQSIQKQDSSKWNIQDDMIRNILEGGNIETIHRIDINFQISQKSLDSLIGRTAHIQILTNHTAHRMIFSCISTIFQ